MQVNVLDKVVLLVIQLVYCKWINRSLYVSSYIFKVTCQTLLLLTSDSTFTSCNIKDFFLSGRLGNVYLSLSGFQVPCKRTVQRSHLLIFLTTEYQPTALETNLGYTKEWKEAKGVCLENFLGFLQRCRC